RVEVVLDVLDVLAALEQQYLKPLLRELLRGPSAGYARSHDDGVIALRRHESLPSLMVLQSTLCSLRDAHREDHRVQAGELQAALELIGRFVVKNPLIPPLPLEDQLAGEEEAAWKLTSDPPAQVRSGRHRLGSHRHARVRREAEAGGELDVAAQIGGR